jgi:hypothetical protein
MNAPALIKASNASLEKRRQIIEDKKANPNEPFELEGVQVRYTPHYSSRTTDQTLVHIGPDDTVFATEFYHVPWNIFKESRVWHNFYLDATSQQAVQSILNGAGVKGEVYQTPYDDPPRYNLELGEDVLDCVKLYKYLLKEKKLPNFS